MERSEIRGQHLVHSRISLRSIRIYDDWQASPRPADVAPHPSVPVCGRRQHRKVSLAMGDYFRTRKSPTSTHSCIAAKIVLSRKAKCRELRCVNRVVAMVPEQGQRPVYASAGWEIDLARRELRSSGVPVPLGGRAFEIVAELVQSG